MGCIEIRKRRIGDGCEPLFIAEIGANHNGDPTKAERMLRRLAEMGAEAVKFQLYASEELVADGDRIVTWGPRGRQQSEPIGQLFDRLSLSRDSMAELLAIGRELELLTFATPFSEGSADFLAEQGVPCFKIAASDVGHVQLLRHVAQTGIPVLLSLGKCTIAETERAVETLRSNGCRQLGLMHCVAAYPAPIDEMHLRTVGLLKELYTDAVIGLSDHSIGTTAAIVSVALGGALVEKHVTESRADNGPDHWFSMEIDEVPRLQQQMKEASLVLGTPRSGILKCELTERKTSTRSLVASRNIPVGAAITPADIKIVRPGTGIEPMFLDAVLGLSTTREITENTPLTWNCFK